MRSIGPEFVRLTVQSLSKCQITTTTTSRLPELVLSLWRTCGRCVQGSLILAKARSVLKYLIQILLGQQSSQHLQLESLGVLKQLTFYAEERRLDILECGGMVKALTHTPFSDKGDERLSAILRNLALTPSVRLIMAQDPAILSCMIRLCSQSNQRTVRNVISTIDSLAMEPDSAISIVLHGDGVVLTVLIRLTMDSQDHVVRRRSARAVRLLARDRATPLLVNDNSLMNALSHCALHDLCQDVRREAAEAYASCANLVRAPMPTHTGVLQSLTNLAQKPEAPEAVARAMKQQALCPENRVPMADHAGLLPALAEIALREGISHGCREAVSTALHDLSSAEPNLEKMAIDSVLQALVRNALHPSEDLSRRAVNTLMNLASLPSNRKSMVLHDGLLQALMLYAASNSDATRKANVKKAILTLVPLL